MNKKFKYKKSLLAAILSATLLAGCDGGGSGSSSDTPPVDSGTGSLPEVKPDPTPNPEPTPEPTPDPEPTPEPIPDPEPTPEPEPEPVPTKTGYLTLGGSQRVTGATCNGESSDGFTFKPGEDVTCVAGNTTIATFNTQSEAARSLRAVEKVSFSLEDAQELAGSDDKKSNAVSLVTSSNSCPANTEQVCLTFSSVIESKRFDSLYKQIDLAPEEFKKLVNEEVENNAATDKAPSTHTSPVVPVTTPGTKPDLNASFVSANAEQFYQYQPTEIILSEGRLVDSQGYGVAGVNYYTNSGRGVTGENGEFSFSWGETISFGIDTFELGSVRGNKSTIALTELGDEVRGANIDQLIHRYSTTGQNNTRVVPDDVRKVFAEYPNVINEIINLSLSNGATLGEGEQVVNLPNEFIEQFNTGQAKEIDTAICAKTDGCNEARWFSLTTRNVNDGQIAMSDALQASGVYWLAGLLGLLVLGQRLLKNPAMRLRWDKTLLRLPVIGRVARGLNTARFSRTLSILTASSVPLLEGIQTAAAVSANRYVEQQLLLAADRVREGSSLRAALAELRLFPPMMLYMIASGEQSGELETMLEQAAVNQEREFDTQVGLALGLFEPALVVMMAGVVLFIVIAILEPMLQLNNMVGM
ncbi:TPA: type II secretion system F family protein [Escherichia coli]|nr:type II secretion system F family protein [Escherichia coli]HCB3608112.1 type II secretion system F family protein [Escherichia coli]